MKNSIADAHYKAHVKARWKMVLATMMMALHASIVAWSVCNFAGWIDVVVIMLNLIGFHYYFHMRRRLEQTALAALHRYKAYQHEVAM